MYIRPETTDLRNFKWSLQFAGYWWDRKDMSLRDKIVYVAKILNFALFIALLNWAIFLIPIQDIPYKPYSPLTLWYNSMFITTLYVSFRANKIVEFKEGMSKLMSKYKSDREVQRFNHLNSYLWKFATYFMIWSMMGICLLTSPTLVDIIISLVSPSSNTFYIGFQMEGFLYGRKDRSLKFHIFGLLNGILQIVPLTYFVFFIVMLPAVVTYVYFALEVMETKLREWDDQNISEQKRRELLKEIVDDHVETLRLLDLMKSLLSPMYVLQNVIWCFNTGYYAHFAKMALKKGDISLTFIEIYLVIIAASGMFISTFIGQILYEKGLEVSDTIYKLIWFKKSVADQRDLHIVMIKAQKIVAIDFKNTFPLNLYTLTDLLNKAYSLFMLLGTIQDA